MCVCVCVCVCAYARTRVCVQLERARKKKINVGLSDGITHSRGIRLWYGFLYETSGGRRSVKLLGHTPLTVL